MTLLPHEAAYDQRSCVIAVSMETAPCSEVSKRERAVMALGFKVRRATRLSAPCALAQGSLTYLRREDRPRDLVFRPRTLDLPEVRTHWLCGR